jgi:hypothetical protein
MFRVRHDPVPPLFLIVDHVIRDQHARRSRSA